jgi:hypothetical protein
MARRVLYENNYTFTPSTRTLVINRYIPRERLILITNVTKGIPILNFSDTRLLATSYTASSAGTTTIVFAYNTVSMSATDNLQIMVDEPYEYMVPGETYMDPVGKLRVSTPQALIDTDFEYGLQPTKWENIQFVNNRASAYYLPQNPDATVTNIATVSGSRTVTVTTTSPQAVGSIVYVNGTTYGIADGFYVVDTQSAGASYTYLMKNAATATTSIYNSGPTQVFNAGLYSGSSIPVTSITNSSTTVTVTTTSPHGLRIGNYVLLRNWTASTNAPNGTWCITAVTSPTVFSFQVINAPTGSIASGSLLARPEGYFYHRPFDGGVQYNTGTSFHGLQAYRQTRRYFRYQSGKGIQMSTNVVFKPGFNVDNITSSGTTVTVQTKLVHALSPGVSISVSGCTSATNATAYNGTFTVASVTGPYTFTYVAALVPGALTSGIPYVSVNNWYNAAIRVGMFDTQNGFFYEFDGQNIYAVRRNSTTQISGLVTPTNGSGSITGVGTLFSKQLVPGDFIVIRGTSYRVETITSDTAMTILPEYRGPSLTTPSGAIVSKTIDTKISQSLWNIDKMDGTGPSGMNLDLTKSQMIYMDYSWYGAGAIRFGFKDIKGEVVYCHRLVNNNTNTEAYMRSGNLPARYETNTLGAYTQLGATLASSGTTMTVADTTYFPTSGNLLIANSVGGYEYVAYTGKTATTFTGLTRGIGGSSPASVVTVSGSATITGASLTTAAVQPGMFVTGTGIPDGTYVVSVVNATSALLSNAATASGTITLTVYAMGTVNPTHTYSATQPIGIYGHTPQFAPLISHWGSSVIMDGRFDDDKSFVFTYGMNSPLAIASGATNAILSLRSAPSVDNGLTGTLGTKEIINRMQLTLRSLGLQTDGRFLVQLILNGTPSSGTFSQATGNPSSLSQVATHSTGTTISGGEVVYAFFTDGAGGGTYGTSTQDVNLVRDLGNSIIGGGTNNTVGSQVYPDGPDILTLTLTNLEASSRNAIGRISWTEAQA